MLAADYLIDIGPGAGVHGGEIIAQGTPEEINEQSQFPYRTIFIREKIYSAAE